MLTPLLALSLAIPAAGTAITVSLAAAGPAHAATAAICAGGECLDAWGGGPTVRMGTPGGTNEEFTFDPLYLCEGNIYVTPSPGCPFVQGYGINIGLRGYEIGQIVYVPTGQCVGSSGNTAILTKCNVVSTGTGGGPGTVQVNQAGELVNRAGTNASSSADHEAVLKWLASGGGYGAQLYMSTLFPSSWSGL